MTDPTAAQSPDEPQAAPAPAPQPSVSPGQGGPPADHDHHGIIVFFGVLALILLFVGAVGAGLSGADGGGGSGSDGDEDGSIGQRRRLEQQERRLERKAAQLERREAQLERKAERRRLQAERQQQRQQQGQADPDMNAMLSELTGTVVAQVEAGGGTVYALQTSEGLIALEIGPPRFWAGNDPLAPLVGQTTTIRGTRLPDGDRMAVFVVGDLVIRGFGRPPWAGGASGSNRSAGPSASPQVSPSPSISP